jgi:hypothetical protein
VTVSGPYERTLGTDWSRLSDDETLYRMYALGVATALGYPNDEEFERLSSQAATPYGRSVLELSFEEGRTRAKRNRHDDDSDSEVWNSLVDDEDTESRSAPVKRDPEPKPSPTALPEAVVRAPFLDLTTDDLDRLRIPEFLRGEE